MGATVYQEFRTFERKTTTQAWIKKRAAELSLPSALEKATRKGVTIKDMIVRYLDEYEKV